MKIYVLIFFIFFVGCATIKRASDPNLNTKDSTSSVSENSAKQDVSVQNSSAAETTDLAEQNFTGNQPEILADDEDDATADLSEANLEEVFAEDAKLAQAAQANIINDVVVTEDFEMKKTSRSKNKGAQKYILNAIDFEFDSAQLDKASLKTLAKVLDEIKTVSFKSIKIWGHTDFYGPSVYNEYLGLKRAKAVYDYFKKAGVPAPFIDYDAFGERRPVSVGLVERERRKNRRVEIIVYRDQE